MMMRRPLKRQCTANSRRSYWKHAAQPLFGISELITAFENIKDLPCIAGWTSEDIVVGLTLMSKSSSYGHQEASFRHNFQLVKRSNNSMLPEVLLDWKQKLQWCDAAYATTSSLFCEQASVNPSHIRSWDDGTKTLPQHLVMVHHETREIVLVVRGSATINDFVIDLALVNEPFDSVGGVAHRGISNAASLLLEPIEKQFKELLKLHPSYNIVVTGHSLGGGVASLLTLKLRQKFDNLKCIGFATPACASAEVITHGQDIITTIVNRNDVIPRFHQNSLQSLYNDVSAFDWQQEAKVLATAEIRNSELVKEIDASVEKINATIETATRRVAEDASHFYKEKKIAVADNAEQLLETVVAPIEKRLNLPSSTKALEEIHDVVHSSIAQFKRHDKKTLEPIVKRLYNIELNIRNEINRVSKFDTVSATTALKEKVMQPYLDLQAKVKSVFQTEKSAKSILNVDTKSLYPPGKVYIMHDKSPLEKNQKLHLYKVTNVTAEFDHIVLAESMFKDHLCSSYEQSLDKIIHN